MLACLDFTLHLAIAHGQLYGQIGASADFLNKINIT
jgi:hypothetical protein